MIRPALSILACVALPCLADPCDDLPVPSVTVVRLEDSVVENMTYGYRSLTTLGAEVNRPGRQVLGLTRGTATVRFSSHTPAFVAPGGRWECLSPQITLTYGMAPLTVFVAREFPPGSCAHKEILEHEMRHVAAYRKHLAEIEQGIVDSLKQRFATGSVWRAPTGQSAARLQREIDRRWVPFVEREIGRAKLAQAQIDTAEEYDRVTQSCNGEITRRLQAR